jgi:hypothetical protein
MSNGTGSEQQTTDNKNNGTTDISLTGTMEQQNMEQQEQWSKAEHGTTRQQA